MAKKKKKSRKQGLFSKAINAGLILLGLARPISILLRPIDIQDKINIIIAEATFGLATPGGTPGFQLERGLAFYGPVAAAVGLGKLKQYLMRHFPVRG